MKIVIFGTGVYYEKRKHHFSNVEVVAFLDNNSSVQGTLLDGHAICSPNEIYHLEYDYVCIMSNKYAVEMIKQLLELNVSFDKICGFATFIEISKRLVRNGSMQVYYRDDMLPIDPNKPKVLLVPHELSLTGAPVVMLYAARVLQKNGFQPVVLCPVDGNLRQKFIDEGIQVIIDTLITWKNDYLYNWMKQFRLIIVCTLTLGELVDELTDFDVPVIWWLHESEEVYHDFVPRVKPKSIGKNVSIYAGGQRALDTYEKYFLNHDAKLLLYGIPDENPTPEKGYVRKSEEKIVFAVIALVQPRKGQDLFVEAIANMSSEDKKNAEFWIIGPNPGPFPDFMAQVAEGAASEPKIKILGEWSMDKLMSEYPGIDVIVCPSRDDPMPVVLPEGMMFYKTCITTTGSGTAAFIEDGVNGLVCDIDAKALAEKMAWVINNPQELPSIGNAARELFEKVFSEQAFERELMQIVNEKINR